MRNKLLVLLVVIVCGCMAANAQNRGNIIKYIDENNLFRKGNDVTLASLNLEWPVEINGNGMPALQEELCKELLDVKSTSMENGWREFRNKLGTQIQHMPDSVTRHYLYLELQNLWSVPGQYISFYLKKQEVAQDGTQKSAVKKFFTYDVANDRILSLEDVFTDYIDINNREIFETLLGKNSVCDDYDKPNIDLTVVPQDFAIMGGAGIMSLGGPFDHDNYSTVQINYLYQLGMFRHSFVRWIQGKGKSKKKESTVSPVEFDSTLSPDSITYNISSLPSFPGGNDSMYVFLKHNIKYPSVDKALRNQGRVTLSFIVERDGSLSDITVIGPVSPGLDREAVRVVRLMPKWTPAEKDGVKVRTRMTLPITYRMG